MPTTFTVTTPLDVVANDGKLSLREAITQANAHPGTDTIVLPAGVYRLALTGADDTNAAGDLDVTGSTVFQGAGAGTTIIDGQQLDRVFDVRGTAPQFDRCHVPGPDRPQRPRRRRGRGWHPGGQRRPDGPGLRHHRQPYLRHGGGISNAVLQGTGNVTLVRSTVNRNVAGGFGGGLFVTSNVMGQGACSTSTAARSSATSRETAAASSLLKRI